MSIARRTTLIGSSLNYSPIYHMSVYLLPKTVIKALTKLGELFLARWRY
jgi:hypothetical protein